MSERKMVMIKLMLLIGLSVSLGGILDRLSLILFNYLRFTDIGIIGTLLSITLSYGFLITKLLARNSSRKKYYFIASTALTFLAWLYFATAQLGGTLPDFE